MVLVMIAGALLTFRQVSSYSYSEAPYEVFDWPVPDDRDTLEIRLKDGPMLANSILGPFMILPPKPIPECPESLWSPPGRMNGVYAFTKDLRAGAGWKLVKGLPE
jgi:hypothetical protein